MKRLLVDAQLPIALCVWFAERGWDADRVRTTLRGQAPDREIAAYAERQGLTLLTKDQDFLTRHPPVSSRLIWLRCGNMGNRALRAWLEPRWPQVETRLNMGDRVIEVR